MAASVQEVALARAKRGAAFLDKTFGPGWRKKIRRSRLDMERGGYRPWIPGDCGCILAQLDPKTSSYDPDHGYMAMRQRLGLLRPQRVTTLGFDTGRDYDTVDHDHLTEAWKQVIREGL